MRTRKGVITQHEAWIFSGSSEAWIAPKSDGLLCGMSRFPLGDVLAEPAPWSTNFLLFTQTIPATTSTTSTHDQHPDNTVKMGIDIDDQYVYCARN
jgi:hypothetical protein